MKYKQKTFYDSSKVIPYLKEFKEDVINNSYNILLEQKYKNGVNHREPTNKSLEWILDKCTAEDNVIITDVPKNFSSEKDMFQVVFFHDWYFAWCDLKPEYGLYIVNKYKLEIKK